MKFTRKFLSQDPEEWATLSAYFPTKNKIEEEKGDGEDEKKEDHVFIVKKPFSSNGRGIGFVTSREELDALLDEGSFVHPLDKHKPLAQRYIKNVSLLEGHKFTVRVYAVMTSVDPLRVYVSCIAFFSSFLLTFF